MAKRSNEHVRKTSLVVRLNSAEKELIKKLAERSKAKTMTAYLRAAALNRPGDDRDIFRQILNEQIKMNVEISALPPSPLREQALSTATAYMRWIMKQK